MKKKLSFGIPTVFATILFFSSPLTSLALQNTNQNYPLSSGVTYKQYTYNNTYTNSINHLSINLSDPYTKLAVGLPSPINDIETTTKTANEHTREGNRVVGAVNASFFETNSESDMRYMPLYLISQNNEIVNGGVISDSSSNYVSQPIAFGITEDGNADIENFDFDIKADYNGQSFELTGLNRQRQEKEAIIFTPQNIRTTTDSNKYGMEIVVETASPVTSNYFGQVLEGKVTHIRPYGSVETVQIPKNGFVLSINSADWLNKFENIQLNENIKLSFDINNKWKNSQFMVASGPMLLLDGKPYITMDTSNYRATELAPRSAIAISKDKKTVNLITVDGRLGSFSKGMSLTQFANYLAELGFDRAINLDGGGSTTMGIRKYGSNTVVLANRPSDGYERSVSAILEAISTAPTGAGSQLSASRDQLGTLLIGATVNLRVNYLLDQYYNPVTFNSTNFQVTSDSNIISSTGLNYTGVKAGTDRVLLSYGNAKQTFPVTVVDAPSSLTITSSSTNIEPNGSLTFKALAKDAVGNNLIYSPSQLKWSVEGSLGTISSTGVFKSNGKIGKGKVIAQLGTKVVSKEFEVKSLFEGASYLISSLETTNGWITSQVKSTASLQVSQSPNPTKHGKGSLMLSYNMTGNSDGTAAVYLNRTTSISMPGSPIKMGVWVFGDGNENWLRGRILDGDGIAHTISFTEIDGLNWTGWRYVEASIPSTVTGPIKLDGIYIAQPDVKKQSKGTLYFDKLQAIYTTAYQEPLFNDVSVKHAYVNEIRYLVDREYINGYFDGYFKPEATISRAHAAVLLSRALTLDTTNVTNPNFSDVDISHPYYNEIAAVAQADIVGGKGDGKFDPEGTLTRAQMAAILVTAYNLEGTGSVRFPDVSSEYWAFDSINTLAYNKVTTGYPDGMFKPGLAVSRMHFSVFLYRSINK